MTHTLLSLHSREAENRTVDLVLDAGAAGAAFHWYSGGIATARRIVDAGMLFSVNPMMVADPGRAEFLRWAPAESLLLETD